MTTEEAIANASRTESFGHIEDIGRWEFFQREDGTVYRAPLDCPMDVWGYRMGARFECYAHMTGQMLEHYR